jgi:hypothetical protein
MRWLLYVLPIVGDATSMDLALAQMLCPQADEVCEGARRSRGARANLLRPHTFDPVSGPVPFCSSCSTVAQKLLEQSCRARAVRLKKLNPDKGLRRSRQQALGMARALQKRLRGTRRPGSTPFSTT